MENARKLLVLPLLGLATLSTGCLMAGNYHSARTLEPGTSEFGLTFSVTKYTFTTTTTDGMGNTVTEEDSVAFPNLIPELTYHVGVKENVEVGGRVALGSGAIEADVKYRVYHDQKLHLAVAPAIGYQALFFLQGGILRLPVILTHELSDNFAVTVSAFLQSTHYTLTDEDIDGGAAWDGTLMATGASFGFDLRGETFLIRPSLEFTRNVVDFDDEEFEPFNTVNVMVHLGFIGGREKKQLNRMERKLDRVLENQGDQRPPVEDDSDYDSGGDMQK